MFKRKEQIKLPDQFMDYVQLHERAWGNKMYSGRPKLNAILESPVVVFWRSEDDNEKWIISLHSDLKQVEMHFLKMLFRSSIQPPNKTVFRIFKDQKRVVIKGINIIFGEPPST